MSASIGIKKKTFTNLSTLLLFVIELHHSVKPMTMKIVHTRQLIHATADKMLVVNLKYTTLDQVKQKLNVNILHVPADST